MTTEYITIEDLIETYGERDLPPKGTTPDVVAVDAAIYRASTHVDMILESAGCEFPLDEDTINKLKDYVLSITRYNYKKRSTNVPQFVIDDAANAQNILELIRRNEYPLLKNQQTKTGLRVIDLIIE